MTISEQQYGFMQRKNSTDDMVDLRLLLEKNRGGQKECFCESGVSI